MNLPATQDVGIPWDSLEQEILRLKREMNAVILAHYYQEPEIQDIADYVGDSLDLSRRAAETSAEVIVFAGVHFMAETAKILNPERTVLLPHLDAGCSLAESAPAHLFRRFRQLHPDHIAVTYINSTAEVKALSDIICTSSSAERILAHLPPEVPVLFAPDKNLGRHLMHKTGRRMLLWQGTCTVHEQFSAREIEGLRLEHPGALLIAHPECEETVLAHSDFIGSTGAMLDFVRRHDAPAFIIATEPGILHQMRKSCPDATLLAAPMAAECACNDCPYMKLNTLERVYSCMVQRSPVIELNETLRRSALVPIERMLKLSSATPGEAPDVVASIVRPFRTE